MKAIYHTYNLFIVFAIIILTTSCGAPLEDNDSSGREKVNDFRPPDGNGIGDQNATLLPVSSLNAYSSDLTIKLDWVVPSPYRTQDYKIHIFRSLGDASFNIPSPTSIYSGATNYYPSPQFVPAPLTEYTNSDGVDQANISYDTEYTYHIYLSINSDWSPPVKVTIKTQAQNSGININPTFDIWDKFLYTLNQHNPLLGVTAASIAKCPASVEFANDVVYARNGALKYISDTCNHRIMIYYNQALDSCSDMDGPIIKDMCLEMYAQAPYSPVAVIGQSDFERHGPCGATGSLAASQCLTHPTGLAILGDKLYIADTGNDRVVALNVGKDGCYNMENMMGISTPHQCTFTKVIGKKGPGDLSPYNIVADGEKALNKPHGLYADSNHLYIADSDNYRVVKSCYVNYDNLNKCSPTTWGTSSCRFCGVLGQPSYSEAQSISDVIASHGIIYAPIENSFSQDILPERFRPIKLSAHHGHLVVGARDNYVKDYGAFQVMVRDRILFFESNAIFDDYPLCRDDTFYNSEYCKAFRVLGTVDSNSPVRLPNGESYDSLSYTLRDIDFLLQGNSVIGVMGGRLFFINDYQSNNIIQAYVDPPNGELNSANMRLPVITQMKRVFIHRPLKKITIYDQESGIFHSFNVSL